MQPVALQDMGVRGQEEQLLGISLVPVLITPVGCLAHSARSTGFLMVGLGPISPPFALLGEPCSQQRRPLRSQGAEEDRG